MTTHDTETARAHLEEAASTTRPSASRCVPWGERSASSTSGKYQRVEAYPGWNGTRDVGAGVGMIGWLDEIETCLDRQHGTCAGFTGENAWGACGRCGERLEEHSA